MRMSTNNSSIEPPPCRLPEKLEPILGAHMAASDLSAIERVMLACDGTFTFQLEAFKREAVSVDILSYEETSLEGKAAEILGGAPGRAVLERKVLLYGSDTREPYVFAHSYVDARALPDAMQAALKASPAGIGRLFVDYRLSIFRDLIGYFFEDGSAYASYFPDRRGLSFLARVYRVWFKESPVMVITEKMPRDLFDE